MSFYIMGAFTNAHTSFTVYNKIKFWQLYAKNVIIGTDVLCFYNT